MGLQMGLEVLPTKPREVCWLCFFFILVERDLLMSWSGEFWSLNLFYLFSFLLYV